MASSGAGSDGLRPSNVRIDRHGPRWWREGQTGHRDYLEADRRRSRGIHAGILAATIAIPPHCLGGSMPPRVCRYDVETSYPTPDDAAELVRVG